jgi:hypothetical protein
MAARKKKNNRGMPIGRGVPLSQAIADLQAEVAALKQAIEQTPRTVRIVEYFWFGAKKRIEWRS